MNFGHGMQIVSGATLGDAPPSSPATAPAPMVLTDWSIANDATAQAGGFAVVSIATLPFNGGSAITDLQWWNGTAWQSLGGNTVGDYVVALANGAHVGIMVRAVNGVGVAADSDSKAVTVSDVVPASVSGTLNATTNVMDFGTNEGGTVFWATVDPSSAPSKPDIETGTGTYANGNFPAAAGNHTIDKTGTPAGAREMHWFHRDPNGVETTIQITAFTEPSGGASSISIISNPIEIAAQTTNNTTDITESPFTTVAGTDTALLLLVPGYQSSGATQEGLVTPQWDGVDMVRILVSAEAGKEWAEGWILLNPTVKTETMVLTALNNQNAIGGVLMQLAGVHQTTPTAGAAQSKGTGTSTSFGVTTTADESWIIGLVTVESNEQPFTANNGATVRISGNTGTSEFSDLSYAVVTKLVPTAGADTPGVDWASDEKFIQIQFELLKA